MIIRDIIRKIGRAKGISRFYSSLRYMLGEKNSSIDSALKKAFKDNVHLLKNEGTTEEIELGDRVAGIYVGGVLSIETAIDEMEAVARRRDCSDPVLHSVIAYHSQAGEKPTPEQIQNDVIKFMRDRGLVDAPALRGKTTAEQRAEHSKNDINQYVAVVHGDTDNLHVHVLANRVSRSGHIASTGNNNIKNDNIAADISMQADRNYEIVYSVFSSPKMQEQARNNGATQEEIEQLATGNYKTLSALRNEEETHLRLTAPERAAREADKASFVKDYGDNIKNIFDQSSSFQSFKNECYDSGIIVKFAQRLKKDGSAMTDKNGQILYGVSFSDIYNKAGKSGTQVGLPAKLIIEKFGLPTPNWSQQRSTIDADQAAQESLDKRQGTGQEKLRKGNLGSSKATTYSASITDGEKAFQSLVFNDQAAFLTDSNQLHKEQSSLQQKIINSGSYVGLFRQAKTDRDARQARLQKRMKSNFMSAKWGTDILLKFEKERFKIEQNYNATPPYQIDKRKRILMRIKSIDAKAQYEIYKKQFGINKSNKKKSIFNFSKNKISISYNFKNRMLKKLRLSIDKRLYNNRTAHQLRRERDRSFKEGVYKQRDKELSELDKTKPATYLQWLKDQPNTETIKAALQIEVARQEWLKNPNTQTQTTAPKPTSKIKDENGSDIRESYSDRLVKLREIQDRRSELEKLERLKNFKKIIEENKENQQSNDSNSTVIIAGNDRPSLTRRPLKSKRSGPSIGE